METFHFQPSQTFDEVRAQLERLNQPTWRHLVAHLTWLEGSAQGQSMPYLWDPMADRFGHRIDKESISVQIVSSLLNGIPVDVTLAQPARHPDRD